MDPPPLTAARARALADLLDDPSPAVRRALFSHLQELGPVGEKFLRDLSQGSNRVAGLHARRFLADLCTSDPITEFRSFIRSQNYELETGVIMLSRTVYPELDVSQVCRQIDAIAHRCRELMVEPLPVLEKCRIINRVLFHEYGFRGNVDNYTDPENSFLNRVLERRKGLPITLSVLYLLVADRCGLRLEPVGVPGHFVVGCFTDGPAFFIDAFDRGRFLSAAELIRYLSGQVIQPDISCLVPSTVREVLCRCCRNLAGHFNDTNNVPFARLFSSFVEDFEATYQKNLSS